MKTSISPARAEAREPLGREYGRATVAAGRRNRRSVLARLVGMAVEADRCSVLLLSTLDERSR